MSEKKSGGMVSMLGFIMGLAIACALFGGTMLLIVGGMMPTIVSLITDRTQQKTGAIAISVLNFAGVLPFVISLWHQGGDMTDAIRIAAQPISWLVMFGMAGIGWFIYNYIPKMIATFAAARAQSGINVRQDLQRALIDRWGPRVTSDQPLSMLEKRMIIGIGTDLIDITRIEKTLARYGQRFLDRVFTSGEQAKAASRHAPGPTLAKRFAAKEACAKALGTGISAGVNWRGMEVINLPSGKPTMRLSGGAEKRLNALLPAGHKAIIHLAITDDIPHAQAFVVVEALPI